MTKIFYSYDVFAGLIFLQRQTMTSSQPWLLEFKDAENKYFEYLDVYIISVNVSCVCGQCVAVKRGVAAWWIIQTVPTAVFHTMIHIGLSNF